MITTFKILYWQEVPSQIKAEDERDEVTVVLGPRFMERARQAVERYKQATGLPVMAQPNAGQPKLVDMVVFLGNGAF